MSHGRDYVITEQAGSNAFHITMCVLTGGLWLLVWPFCRRRRVVKVRARFDPAELARLAVKEYNRRMAEINRQDTR